MRSPPVAALLLLVLAAAACADDPASDVAPTSSADYLAAVEELLDPPSRLASVTASRLADGGAPAVDVALLGDAARRERAEFARLRLESPVLASQRDRLLEGFADLVATIDPLVAAHDDGSRAEIAAAAGPFYDALQALPASVPPPDAP